MFYPTSTLRAIFSHIHTICYTTTISYARGDLKQAPCGLSSLAYTIASLPYLTLEGTQKTSPKLVQPHAQELSYERDGTLEPPLKRASRAPSDEAGIAEEAVDVANSPLTASGTVATQASSCCSDLRRFCPEGERPPLAPGEPVVVPFSMRLD